MESIILQVEGRKEWSLYKSLIQLPYPTMKFKPSSGEVGREKRRLSLAPLDVMYLPSGQMHEARTVAPEGGDKGRRRGNGGKGGQGEEGEGREEGNDAGGGPSLHLTFGVEIDPQFSWESILHTALDIVHKRQLAPLANSYGNGNRTRAYKSATAATTTSVELDSGGGELEIATDGQEEREEDRGALEVAGEADETALDSRASCALLSDPSGHSAPSEPLKAMHELETLRWIDVAHLALHHLAMARTSKGLRSSLPPSTADVTRTGERREIHGEGERQGTEKGKGVVKPSQAEGDTALRKKFGGLLRLVRRKASMRGALEMLMSGECLTHVAAMVGAVGVGVEDAVEDVVEDARLSVHSFDAARGDTNVHVCHRRLNGDASKGGEERRGAKTTATTFAEEAESAFSNALTRAINEAVGDPSIVTAAVTLVRRRSEAARREWLGEQQRHLRRHELSQPWSPQELVPQHPPPDAAPL